MKYKRPSPLSNPRCDVRAEFRSALDEAFKLYHEPLPEPPELYHFTSIPGIKGILQSGDLWASDLRVMKDPTELRYATGILSQVAGEFPHCLESFRDKLADELLGLGFHLACLSMRKDLQRQWNDYADELRGCAIIFDTARLKERCAEVEVFGFPLAYDPLIQVQMFELAFHKEEELRRIIAKRKWATVLHLELLMTLGSILTVVKNEACSFEHEWRLQIVKLDGFKAVARGGGLVSRELPVCTPDTVVGLLLGPKCPMSVDEAQNLLIKLGYLCAKVARVSEAELITHPSWQPGPA